MKTESSAAAFLRSAAGLCVSHFPILLLQLDYPNMVEGLLLININPCAAGWMDWAAHKVTSALRLH